jgi:uncharacterized protein (DUF1800 family)
MTLNIQMSPTTIAVNRFGLGARPDGVNIGDPKQWLLAQFNRYQASPAAWANQTKSAELVASYAEKIKEMRKANDTGQKQNDEAKNQTKNLFRREIRDDYQEAVTMRAESALNTPAPFIEHLVHFWANHFAVSIEKPAVVELAGAFELEAIRPYVLGNFTDMLLAVEQHPAMLLYLDQAKSIGPNSIAATRLAERNPDKKRGLNENLAREILELHTLGVHGGYSQADVTEFARALTGWSVAEVGKTPKRLFKNNLMPIEGANGFAFLPVLHEPDSRTILGKTYAQQGKAQAESVLRDVAISPATANHIATKLARHFVSDTPPPSLIDKLSSTFLKTGGQLNQVYRTLIDAPEAWQPAPAKFKAPWEWLISCLRATGRQNLNGLKIAQIMNQLSQPIWKPGSPAGFDDVADTWAAPNALLRRIELAQRIANQLGDKVDARTLADKVLPGTLSEQTKTAIMRAESATTGLALLLVSPEFLRR